MNSTFLLLDFDLILLWLLLFGVGGAGAGALVSLFPLTISKAMGRSSIKL
jgi:hypothetical protein